MSTTSRRQQNNETARRAIDKIDDTLDDLDEKERELNALDPEPGSEAEKRKKKLLAAIRKKRESLAEQERILRAYLKSKDSDERTRLWKDYKAEKADFASREAFADRVAEVCVPCQLGLGRFRSREKTVWAHVVELSFDGDHKLLKPSPTDYKDQPAKPFSAPHWVRREGVPTSSFPLSYTKDQPVQVTGKFHFHVSSNPAGQSASWTKVKGITSVRDHGSGDWEEFPELKFEGAPAAGSVTSGEYATTKLTSEGNLYDYVWDYELRIRWYVQAEGKWLRAGTTFHRLYATYDRPRGKMSSTTPNYFEEKGPTQDVTEERLKLAVVAARTRWKLPDEGDPYRDGSARRKTERKCVDAVFWDLKGRGIVYTLDHRWEPGSVNNTKIRPKPTLHHYLWRTMAETAYGECHNIAAAFILMCRILGVSGPMSVGYMYPKPGRADSHPKYPWKGGPLGSWNKRHSRSHKEPGHGYEELVFIDASHYANNFEGAVEYDGNYYAIGEDIFESPSHFYGDPGVRGSFMLFFWGCSKPYPDHWRSTRVDDPTGGPESSSAGFKWHWGKPS